MTENNLAIPPIYNRPSNIQRKMELVARCIADIKNTQGYYGWIFANDPWFAQRLQDTEIIYAELVAAFKDELKGLGSEEEIREACHRVVQRQMDTWNLVGKDEKPDEHNHI